MKSELTFAIAFLVGAALSIIVNYDELTKALQEIFTNVWKV